jgi:alkylhydroperoxidase/carboxymuconolactone decarboxylase family protein YurZ
MTFISTSGADARPIETTQEHETMTREDTLSTQQQAIAPIAAFAAAGDMPRLDDALNRGLEAGLTIGEIKEILVQLYAYAGFPRSLNALGQLMKVTERVANGAFTMRPAAIRATRFRKAMRCSLPAPRIRRNWPARR